MNTLVKFAKKSLSMAVVASACIAGTANASADWVYNATITDVTVQPNQFIQITIENGTVPNQSCSLNDGKTMELKPGTPHYEHQYTAAMAALLSGKKASFYVDGCANAFAHASVIRVSNQL